MKKIHFLTLSLLGMVFANASQQNGNTQVPVVNKDGASQKGNIQAPVVNKDGTPQKGNIQAPVVNKDGAPQKGNNQTLEANNNQKKEEADKKAKEEADKKAKEEADKKAKEEADKKTKEEKTNPPKGEKHVQAKPLTAALEYQLQCQRNFQHAFRQHLQEASCRKGGFIDAGVNCNKQDQVVTDFSYLKFSEKTDKKDSIKETKDTISQICYFLAGGKINAKTKITPIQLKGDWGVDGKHDDEKERDVTIQSRSDVMALFGSTVQYLEAMIHPDVVAAVKKSAPVK